MMNKSLIQIIKEIGLNDRHAKVYQALLEKPRATPLQLARETSLNRSSLYRYLEDLRELGLVELVLSDKSSVYIAKPEGLNQYLANQEARVDALKKVIPQLAEDLLKVTQTGQESEVRYFRGVEGLKQMLWNVASAKIEVMGLGYQDWNSSVGKTYADKLRQKMMENGNASREILNSVDDSFGYTSLGKNYTKVYEHRKIDSRLIDIKHDTYIYGDVFAYYYHYQGEYFGVEIHNKEIARTEKQMFEILWNMAK